MFHQAIRDGWQVELTDCWLRYGNPWEIRRPQACVEVGFGGHTQSWADSFGEYKVLWTPAEVVKGVPYDTPIWDIARGLRTLFDSGGPKPLSRSTSTDLIAASSARITWAKRIWIRRRGRRCRSTTLLA
jgi:hypothetical protein